MNYEGNTETNHIEEDKPKPLSDDLNVFKYNHRMEMKKKS